MSKNITPNYLIVLLVLMILPLIGFFRITGFAAAQSTQTLSISGIVLVGFALLAFFLAKPISFSSPTAVPRTSFSSMGPNRNIVWIGAIIAIVIVALALGGIFLIGGSPQSQLQAKIDQSCNGLKAGNVDMVAQTMEECAKLDSDECRTAKTQVVASSGLIKECKLQVSNVDVRGDSATADVDGSLTASVLGVQMVLPVSSTSTFVKIGGQWYVSRGETATISGMAKPVPPTINCYKCDGTTYAYQGTTCPNLNCQQTVIPVTTSTEVVLSSYETYIYSYESRSWTGYTPIGQRISLRLKARIDDSVVDGWSNPMQIVFNGNTITLYRLSNKAFSFGTASQDYGDWYSNGAWWVPYSPNYYSNDIYSSQYSVTYGGPAYDFAFDVTDLVMRNGLNTVTIYHNGNSAGMSLVIRDLKLTGY